MMTRLHKFLSSELFIGALVALLSIFTAFSAYQAALSDSAEGDANVGAQKILSLSNTEFLRANQAIVQDYTMYDGYYASQASDPELAAYYQGNFSDPLKAGMERPGGPFDDAYYDQHFADADSAYDEALAKFDEAQKAGDRADNYQKVVLIFAVGLSLAAWASLVKEESWLRPAFAVFSLLVLLFGLSNYLGV